jgi:amino acid adenylation domain-containing protein
MSHQVFDTGRGPMFDIRAALLAGGTVRTYFSIDCLVVDAGSLSVLFGEWEQLYAEPDRELPRLEATFRDYALAAAKVKQTPLYRLSHEYWSRRLSTLPAAPQLPLAKSPKSIAQPRFVRRSHRLEERSWSRLKKAAAALVVTPTTLLATVFAEVLATWSRSPRFTLNLTLFNRLPLHCDVHALVGDFTSLTLLEMEISERDDFGARARKVQKRLWADLDNRYVGGVEVLREIGREQETVVLMPIVFTSTLGLVVPMNGESSLLGKEVYGITQTPQVSLDHLVFEGADGDLRYSWDAVEELFPPGMLDEMFEAYRRRLEQLAEGRDRECPSLVPAQQKEAYVRWNATEGPAPSGLLQARLMDQARLHPEEIAVIAPGRTMRYQELASESRRIGRRLRDLGVVPNELVAIVMERGWEQVVGVVGVLESGGAYVPVDADLPPERRSHLLKRCGARVVLTQPRVEALGPWPDGVKRLCVEAHGLDSVSDAPLEPAQKETDLAYVIFTSGSTGMPKGVMIEHRGAVNTVDDVNARHRLTAKDRVLGLSSLSFDLSVYDIFGVLGAGGAVVLIGSGDLREPDRWAELIERHSVTVWNSVPALMQMMLTHLEGRDRSALRSLRLALLSGDWLPVGLPDRLRAQVEGVKVVSMGGATEASIWSIDYPIERVDAGWPSIPYGKPMRNQRWYVLGSGMQARPVWVPGELYIGGTGLARGYLGDEEKTTERFFEHPRTGERLYRTGDFGRYLDDGNIEFLGREDGQVKVRGFRVELGEIDAAISSLPEVREALSVAYEDASGQKSLAAYVVLREGSEMGSAAIRSRLAAKLPDYMVPTHVLFLSALPLSANGKIDRKALASPTAVPSGDAYAAPRTEPEEKMVALWQELLRKERVGITDNFFRLGGNSLLAVSLVSRAPRDLGMTIALGAVLAHPTIEGLLSSLDAPAKAPSKVRHLVTLTPRGSRPPLVLMSGLGGFAFVFRGLARFLGEEQPLHVLNAIGAEDNRESLDLSIEEMAAIYESQILAACPSGPIILGGYSFGMLVAFEIARGLHARGRAFPLLVSFDGFAPGFPRLQPLPKRLLAHAKVFLSGHPPGRRAFLRDRVRGLRARVYDRLGRAEENVATIPYADPETDIRLRKVSAALWKAGLVYRPEHALPGDLLLIKTSISDYWIGNDMDDPLYGWKDWLHGQIELVTVPGEHLTLFDDANQRRIACAVSHAIDARGGAPTAKRRTAIV